MARVTVEDCLDNVDNRFQLVLVATKRARQLANGVTPFLDWENDKPTIVALREIAEGLIGPSILEEQVRLEIELDEEMPEEEQEAPVALAADEVPQDAPEETGSQETGSQETGSQETGSQETGSQETGSQETDSRETDSRETGSQETDSREAGSQEADSREETASDDDVPREEAD